MKKNLLPTIGLEVHCELRTNSKLFCGCPADHFGREPNTQTCPVCLGLPGELPVTNKKAVEWTILLGLALNSKINKEAKFDRKHYFYPDLPMGFQISQYDEPFATGGWLKFPISNFQFPNKTEECKIQIQRVHLEIDTGKLQHTTLDGEDVSLIDFNRSGVALIEIVTEPVIQSGLQAKEFAKSLQQIIRYLGISDCDMEKGSMRLEANISWGLDLGYKVEVKNLNSFRFLEKAINYELDRQKMILDAGKKIIQETRGWSEIKQKTFSQRTKETSEDYRYFPDPDLPPFSFNASFIENIRSSLPELPSDKRKRFLQDYKLPENYVDFLTAEKVNADFYEDAFKIGLSENIDAKTIANLIVNKGLVAKKPRDLVEAARKASTSNFSNEQEAKKAVNEVIKEQENAVLEYKNGKEQVLGFLIGMVQKKLKGQGDPNKITQQLKSSL